MVAGIGDREEAEADNPLSNHGRHASLMVITDWLHDILVGRVAQQMLDDKVELPAKGAIYVPPSYGWMFSAISVGRKDRDMNGDRMLMPVRLVWDKQIFIMDAEKARRAKTLSWSTNSMGHDESGKCRVECAKTSDGEDVVTLSDSLVPSEVTVPIVSRRELKNQLLELAEGRRSGYWNLASYFEPVAVILIKRAHSYLSKSVGLLTGQEDRPLLDAVALEQIRTHFMYDTYEEKGKFAMMIERVLDPSSMRKVDPLRYINAAMSRDAKENVRKALGDNRTGHRLRVLAADLGSTDIEVVVAAARQLWPKESIDVKRVDAALNVKPDPMATRWDLVEDGANASDEGDVEHYGEAPDDHEDGRYVYSFDR